MTTASPDACPIRLGRALCNDLAAAVRREWLVANGLGGYAMGTVAGTLSRRYHGLLVAATSPPVRRVLLLAALEPEIEVGDREGQRAEPVWTQSLWTQEWQDGSVSPMGHLHIEEFRLEGSIPVTAWALGQRRIERRIWMPHGSNSVVVRFTLAGGPPTRLRLRALTTHRSHHATLPTPRPAPMIEHAERGVRIVAYPGATTLWIQSADGHVMPGPGEAWANLLLSTEKARGYDCIDSHHHSATIEADLVRGGTLTVVAGTEPAATLDGALLLESRRARDARVVAKASALAPRDDLDRQIVLAADQFVVARTVRLGEPRPSERSAQGGPDAHRDGTTFDGASIVAGYPWFEDWGRDTFIALPGLCLATGRVDDAARIVRTFASALDRGMLPNRFPDEGGAAEYHTVDATLWFVEVACRTIERLPQKEGEALRSDLAETFAQILHWHVEGTRHGIGLDERDGLLRAGEPGVQLTWMDAKIGDRVITPRIGKPVEVAALWHAVLMRTARFATALGRPLGEFSASRLVQMAAKAREGFGRFWNPATGCLLDVLDGPEGPDPTVRPNQLIAVALPDSPVDDEQAARIVQRCADDLLTSFGMRTLDPADPRFCPRYGGTQEVRDAAYHQGTVWPWLMAPFALAHLRVHRDRAAALALLEPLRLHLLDAGLGSISEVCDGAVPHTPGGCPAQAWSVAAVLEVMERAAAVGRG